MAMNEDNGEHQGIEEKLAQSEALFRNYFELGQVGMAITSLDQQWLQVNRRLCEMLGYTKEELCATTWTALTHPDDLDANMAQFRKLLSGEIERYSMHKRFFRKDGSIVHTDLAVACQRKIDGTADYVIASLQDITERKQAETARQANEQRLQLAIRCGHLGVWDLDLIDHTAYRSLEHDRIFGYETLLPQWTFEMFLDHVISEDRVEVNRLFCEAVAQQADWSFECRIRRVDGQVRWIWATGCHQRDLDGAMRRMIGIVQDITERKQVEDQLRSASQYARSLIEASLDPLVTISPEGKITDVNEACERVTGIPRVALIGSDFPDCFTEPDKARTGYREVFAMGFVTDYPLTLRHVSGKVRDVLCNASVYRNGNGEVAGVFAAARDITELNQAKARIQRREQLYAALSHCNKAILHCADEEELFLQTCRAAVQFGGMRMAWIGLVDTETGRVRPAGTCGDNAGYLEDLNVSVDADSPFGRGPTGTAIRENRPVWCQSFFDDPYTVPWQERGVRIGWAASASLPLRRNGVVIGAFNLYSDEANAFDQAACDLLVEMADDISFALDNFAREAARKQAQALDKIHYRIFERLAQGSELPDVLALVVSYIETAAPDFIGSIMLLDADGKHLLLAAAPSLPDYYKAAINRIAVAGGFGSCTAAAWRAETVTVEDIRSHPNWAPFKHLALQAGLLSCRSELIVNSSGKVLGTFDIYQRQAAGPSQSNLEQLRRAIHFAVIAIERKLMEERLRASESEFRTLAEHLPEMIVRYDRNCRRIYINPAYEQQTGIPLEEAWDRAPNEVGKVRMSSDAYMAWLRRVMDSGEPDHILLEWHTPDGSLVSHEMHAVAEYDEKGQVVAALVMGHNITELKATERRLEESRAQLLALTAKREEAREEERKRIAREIHDELGQLLNVLRLNVSTLDFRFGDANADLRDKSHKMIGTIDRAILMVRNLATRLRPAVLNSGIVQALDWLVREYAESTGIICTLNLPDHDIPLDEDRAIVVFRIVQESLTNVLRHSEADQVSITLCSAAGICEVEVRDNGKGFASGNIGRANSFGIVGMQERALILKGTLEVGNAMGGGAVLTLRIPVEKGGDLNETPIL